MCVLHFVSLCSFHFVYHKCVWRLKIRLLVLKSLLLSIVSILLWLTVLHFTWLITTALNVISFHCCSALVTDSGFDRERRGSQPDSLLWCWSHKKCDFQPRLTCILAFLNKARLALLPERQWVLLIHTQQVTLSGFIKCIIHLVVVLIWQKKYDKVLRASVLFKVNLAENKH